MNLNHCIMVPERGFRQAVLFTIVRNRREGRKIDRVGSFCATRDPPKSRSGVK